jgi:hypothetical protein
VTALHRNAYRDRLGVEGIDVGHGRTFGGEPVIGIALPAGKTMPPQIEVDAKHLLVAQRCRFFHGSFGYGCEIVPTIARSVILVAERRNGWIAVADRTIAATPLSGCNYRELRNGGCAANNW